MKNSGRNSQTQSQETQDQERIVYKGSLDLPVDGKDYAHRRVQVLYQRLGSRWYAISCFDDEIYYGIIPEGVVKDL